MSRPPLPPRLEPEAAVAIQPDDWLSSVLGYHAFTVAPSVEPDALNEHARRQDRAFYTAKIDVRHVETVQRFAHTGLGVVDVQMTFCTESSGQAVRPTTAVSSGAVVVRAIDRQQPSERQQVLELAGSCFRWSRFHQDHRLSKAVADRIKQEWVRSYLLQQRGDELYVAIHDRRIAGFLAALSAHRDGQRVQVIDLIGVAEPLQRQGVGRRLVEHFLQQVAPDGAQCEVGTQARNGGSIRLYERCGFVFDRAAYVLHKHVTHADRP